MITIRPENSTDYTIIHQVNTAAFETSAEADLIDRLRSADAILFSLVAIKDQQIVAHILFSPVTIRNGEISHASVGLGPVAVHPDYQQQGIGSQLIRAGLAACRTAEVAHVFLLGHASYYPRFGFVPSHTYNIRYEHPVSPPVFMCLELIPDTLTHIEGVLHFHPAFNAV